MRFVSRGLASVFMKLVFQKKLQISVHFLSIGIYLKVNLTFGVVYVADFLHSGSMKPRLKVYYFGFLDRQKKKKKSSSL